MHNSYYITSRISKEMISSAKFDIVERTKRDMVHDLIEKAMEDKEIDLNKVALKIQFVEFNINDTDKGSYLAIFPCKEIQARLRVIPYA